LVLLTPTSETDNATGRKGRDAATDAPVEGATLVVERPTAEAAISEVHDRLGADARILEARRVARGGIGGFFAKEVVQIHAAPAAAGEPAGTPGGPAVGTMTTSRGPAPAAAPAASAGSAVAGASSAHAAVAGAASAETDQRSPIERVLAGAEQATDALDFATFLRHQLASGEFDDTPMASAASAPAPTPQAPATQDPLMQTPATQVPAAQPMHWPDLATQEQTAPAPAARSLADTLADERPAWADQLLADAAGSVAPANAPEHAAVATPAAGASTVAHAAEAATVRGAATVAHAPEAEALAPGTSAPAAAAHAPAVDVVGGPTDEPPASTDGGPAWSVTTLLRMGLPSELVRSMEVAAPADDVAWTSALATALRPLCRPLPTGRCLLVGPKARGLANALGTPTVAIGQPLRVRGDVAAAVGSGAAGQTWLDRVRKDRWIHLVAGGVGWRELLHTDPLAVSWASEDDLADAIRCAVELGLVLGHGPSGGWTGRARPLDVALTIRDLVPWQ
jgi:hypothetical protein